MNYFFFFPTTNDCVDFENALSIHNSTFHSYCYPKEGPKQGIRFYTTLVACCKKKEKKKQYNVDILVSEMHQQTFQRNRKISIKSFEPLLLFEVISYNLLLDKDYMLTLPAFDHI